jgi:hypothetical protein
MCPILLNASIEANPHFVIVVLQSTPLSLPRSASCAARASEERDVAIGTEDGLADYQFWSGNHYAARNTRSSPQRMGPNRRIWERGLRALDTAGASGSYHRRADVRIEPKLAPRRSSTFEISTIFQALTGALRSACSGRVSFPDRRGIRDGSSIVEA